MTGPDRPGGLAPPPAAGPAFAEAWAGARDALTTVVPSILAYGAVWGGLARQAGLSQGELVAMCLLVTAGTAQFVALPMLQSGAPAWLLVATTYVVNLRRGGGGGPRARRQGGGGRHVAHRRGRARRLRAGRGARAPGAPARGGWLGVRSGLLLTFAAMGAATYLARAPLLVVLAGRRLPGWLDRYVAALPIALLTAVALPLVLLGDGAGRPWLTDLPGAAAVALLARRTGHLLLAVAGGVVLVAALRALLG